MRENINYKQYIWVFTILVIIILSLIGFILSLNGEMQYNENNDDILGSNMDLAIGILLASPYFVSLIVLLHSGYICFSSKSFIAYRRWYYVSIALATLAILLFGVAIIYYYLNDSLVTVKSLEIMIVLSILASCAGLIFDIIGTISPRSNNGQS